MRSVEGDWIPDWGAKTPQAAHHSKKKGKKNTPDLLTVGTTWISSYFFQLLQYVNSIVSLSENTKLEVNSTIQCLLFSREVLPSNRRIIWAVEFYSNVHWILISTGTSTHLRKLFVSCSSLSIIVSKCNGVQTLTSIYVHSLHAHGLFHLFLQKINKTREFVMYKCVTIRLSNHLDT